MVHVIFKFSDGDVDRFFNTTFDALCDVLTAYNMYEGCFIGARFADDKEGKYIGILNAEHIVKDINRVREYLTIAVCSGFNDSQIISDVKHLYGVEISEVPASWKQYMKEYWDNLVEGVERFQKFLNAED